MVGTSFTLPAFGLEPGVNQITVSATNEFGLTAEPQTVSVNCTLPGVSLIATEPQTLLEAGDTTLSWQTVNGSTIVLSYGAEQINLAESGNLPVPLTETTVFTITVTNEDDISTSAQITVHVLTAENTLPDDGYLGLAVDEQQGGGGLLSNVRIMNGNMVEVRSDVSFSSPHGMGLGLGAVYNSRSDHQGVMGYGWTHTYEASLDPTVTIGSTTFLRIIDNTGRARYFSNAGGGSFVGSFYEKSWVNLQNGNYDWQRLDGSLWRFDSSGLRIPDDPDHPFHLIPATDSISSRPVIPGHSGH